MLNRIMHTRPSLLAVTIALSTLVLCFLGLLDLLDRINPAGARSALVWTEIIPDDAAGRADEYLVLRESGARAWCIPSGDGSMWLASTSSGGDLLESDRPCPPKVEVTP